MYNLTRALCSKRKLELVAIARKRFKVADKVTIPRILVEVRLVQSLIFPIQVEHGAKLEDLQAAGKDKRAFVAQVTKICFNLQGRTREHS